MYKHDSMDSTDDASDDQSGSGERVNNLKLAGCRTCRCSSGVPFKIGISIAET